ncbi:MAG: ABC transporter permease [Anaerolineae bacterium]
MARTLMTLIVLLICLLFAGNLAPYDPLSAVGESLAPPSKDHWFGTDLIGRDVFSRTLHGAARTATIASISLLVAVLPSLAFATMVALGNFWMDSLLRLVTDALLALPSLLLALCFLTILGRGTWVVAISVGVALLPSYARLARGILRATAQQPYLEAARAVGCWRGYMLVHYLLLNAAPSLLNAAVMTLAWAMLNAAALNFLGFGGDPSLPEWGAMLAEARSVFRAAPWAAFAPGMAITLTIALLQRLADRAVRIG